MESEGDASFLAGVFDSDLAVNWLVPTVENDQELDYSVTKDLIRVAMPYRFELERAGHSAVYHLLLVPQYQVGRQVLGFVFVADTSEVKRRARFIVDLDQANTFKVVKVLPDHAVEVTTMVLCPVSGFLKSCTALCENPGVGKAPTKVRKPPVVVDRGCRSPLGMT